jgi:hypothetical protein
MAFVYDDLNRLQSVTSKTDPSLNQTFAYNPIGNMTFNSKKGAYYYDDPAHVHAVTAISKSLRFEWNLTSCFTGPQTITFKINGHVALTTNATDASCSCQPGSRGNVTVTDPAVLAYLKNGPNTFTVSYPEYLSWALVNLGTQGDVLIYDPYGNAAGRPTTYAEQAITMAFQNRPSRQTSPWKLMPMMRIETSFRAGI